MKKSIWKERVRKNASVKSLGPCDTAKRGVYTQEGQSIFTIKEKKRESTSICRGLAKERIYLTF